MKNNVISKNGLKKYENYLKNLFLEKYGFAYNSNQNCSQKIQENIASALHKLVFNPSRINSQITHLCIKGGVGTGKTYILLSLALEMLNNLKSKFVSSNFPLFIDMNEFREIYSTRTLLNFHDAIRNYFWINYNINIALQDNPCTFLLDNIESLAYPDENYSHDLIIEFELLEHNHGAKIIACTRDRRWTNQAKVFFNDNVFEIQPISLFGDISSYEASKTKMMYDLLLQSNELRCHLVMQAISNGETGKEIVKKIIRQRYSNEDAEMIFDILVKIANSPEYDIGIDKSWIKIILSQSKKYKDIKDCYLEGKIHDLIITDVIDTDNGQYRFFPSRLRDALKSNK